MRRMLTPAAVAVLLVYASQVRAQSDEAAACAEGPSPHARMIFEAVAPQLPPEDGTVEDVVRATVRPMVRAGELSRGEARDAAEEARACFLVLLEG